MKPKFYFTFGVGHTDKDGNSLFNKYVCIIANNIDEAYKIMFKKYGPKWSFSYTEKEFTPQIKEYNLTELETIKQDE